jgi:subtilisin family serine protease
MLQSAAALRVIVKVEPSLTSSVQRQAEQQGFQVLGAAPGFLVLARAAPEAHASADRALLQAGRPGTRATKRAPTNFKDEAVALIKAWPGVQMAEVDQRRYLQRALRSISSSTAPSAAHSSSSFVDKELFAPGRVLPERVPYSMAQIQADSTMLPADISSSGVMICVIDSGIDANHPDLRGNKLDGCKAQDNVAPAGCPFNWGQDLLGHGTHVAGIIAARQDGQGTVGVIPQGAELYSVRVFNDSGDVNQGQGYVYGSSLILAYTQCEGRLAAMQVGDG